MEKLEVYIFFYLLTFFINIVRIIKKKYFMYLYDSIIFNVNAKGGISHCVQLRKFCKKKVYENRCAASFKKRSVHRTIKAWPKRRRFSR